MSTTYARTINGNTIYAAISDADAAGNNIQNTYATKSELPDGVPAVTSSDDGKVLKASYTGGTGSFSWETESGGGGGSYSAGTGIDITNNVVSVDTSVVATQTDLAGKQDVISDLATIRSGAAEGATAVQSGDLATVATTGSYDDLADKPTIPTVDQNYDASSTNAQSGVAVASAISAALGPVETALANL